MKKRIIIANDGLKNQAIEIIKGLPFDDKKERHEVIVRPYKRDRSNEQNALYWKWITIIGDDLGYTKDELHNEMKKQLLVPILIRDDPEYSACIEAVNEVHRLGHKVKAKKLAKTITRLTTTTSLKVKQMSEFMNEVEMFASNRGIRLPAPEDLNEPTT